MIGSIKYNVENRGKANLTHKNYGSIKYNVENRGKANLTHKNY